MRKPIVAGNWKMHGSVASVDALLAGLKGFNNPAVEMMVFPPFVFLERVASTLRDSQVAWGAQTVSEYTQGAYTGEVSTAMLVELGCRAVLVGHSERRQLYGESSEQVAAKLQAAVQAGLQPVLCVGETLAEHQQGHAEAVIAAQLAPVFSLPNAAEHLGEAVIAYEPVWAIGTGQTATPEQAQQVHQFIRHQVARVDKEVANGLRILYGGSVKPTNSSALFRMADIDGGLVGGASLNAADFLGIAHSCHS